jgi:hypothetical protein
MAGSQVNKDGVRRPGVSHSLERPPSQSPRYLRGRPTGPASCCSGFEQVHRAAGHAGGSAYRERVVASPSPSRSESLRLTVTRRRGHAKAKASSRGTRQTTRPVTLHAHPVRSAPREHPSGGATSGACRPWPWRRRCPMYPRTARRGQLCGGEELRDHGRDALRRARPPGNRLLLPAHPAVATTGAGDGGAHYPRSARRGQLCGGEGVPGIGKAQALPRTARSRPSCPLQLVTIKRVQKTSLHNRSSWVASTSLSGAEDVAP